MTISVRSGRRVDRDGGFDLRTTSLFFLLLALGLCILAFLTRTAVDFVAHHPVWAGVFAAIVIAVALGLRPRWRHLSAKRCARRAALNLEEAAESASDSLRATEEDASGPRIGAPAESFADAASGDNDCGAEGFRPEAVQATAPLILGDEEETAPHAQVVAYADLDPDGFEQAIADLCVRDGCYGVEVVGGAGDLGADVCADTWDGRRLVIQCKLYNDANKVGSQEMQRFGGTCFAVHEADVAVIVTTSDFTAPALQYAHQCGIVCVNGQDLEAWWGGTGPCLWEDMDVEP